MGSYISIHPTIKFTMEGGSLPFLDTRVTRKEEGPVTVADPGVVFRVPWNPPFARMHTKMTVVQCRAS